MTGSLVSGIILEIEKTNMSETIKKYAVTAVIAILAVMIYNNFIQPKIPAAPTA